MEGRRVEGVLFETSVLQSRAQEAYQSAKALEIRVLSQVPEVLLASLNEAGGRIRASVEQVSQGKVLLNLENNFTIEAKNNLSVPVRPGDKLELTVISSNPLILKVDKVSSGLPSVARLIKNFLSLPAFLNPPETNLKEGVIKSGLFYEKKVWDFLRGALSREAVENDTKYNLLKSLESFDTSKVENLLRKALNLKTLPEDIKDFLSALLKSKVNLLLNLNSIERRLRESAMVLEKASEEIKLSIVRSASFVKEALTKALEATGIKVSFEKETFEKIASSPRSLELIREAVKDLEGFRFTSFKEKLSLLGFEVLNPEKLNDARESLLTLLRDALKGSETFLLSTLKKLPVGYESKLDVFPKEVAKALAEEGFEVSLRASGPKSWEEVVRALQEGIKHLKEGRVKNAVEILRSIGVEVEIPPKANQGNLESIFNDLLSKAQTFKALEEDPLKRAKELLSRFSEESQTLREVEASLQREIPKDIRENLGKLEALSLLQQFVAFSKRSFLLPVKGEDWRGLILFSARNVFRILIHLSFPEGELTITLEAPKVRDPKKLRVRFFTDSPYLRIRVEEERGELEKDLKSLGLEATVDIAENSKPLEDHVREIVEEDASFTLRV